MMKVDHIGIAVRSIEETAALYAAAFGLTVAERYEVPQDGVRLAFLQAGDALLELLEPTGDSTPLARFLTARGPGLHHLAFRVSDIGQAIVRARNAGCQPLDEQGRPGARGKLIAFLHPSSAAGVLIELVQDR